MADVLRFAACAHHPAGERHDRAAQHHVAGKEDCTVGARTADAQHSQRRPARLVEAGCGARDRRVHLADAHRDHVDLQSVNAPAHTPPRRRDQREDVEMGGVAGDDRVPGRRGIDLREDLGFDLAHLDHRMEAVRERPKA